VVLLNQVNIRHDFRRRRRQGVGLAPSRCSCASGYMRLIRNAPAARTIDVNLLTGAERVSPRDRQRRHSQLASAGTSIKEIVCRAGSVPEHNQQLGH
jgi:spore coat protein U-like protein